MKAKYQNPCMQVVVINMDSSVLQNPSSGAIGKSDETVDNPSGNIGGSRTPRSKR